MAKSFEDLLIWEKAHNLTIQIYKITADWPKEEIYGLTSQIRRAAVSVELLIAEGHSRHYFNDIVHFMYNSKASAEEVRDCLMIARDIKTFQLKIEIFNNLNEEYVGLIKGINGFIRYQRNQKSSSLVN